MEGKNGERERERELLLNRNLLQFNEGGRTRFARRVISGLEPSDRNILGNGCCLGPTF